MAWKVKKIKKNEFNSFITWAPQRNKTWKTMSFSKTKLFLKLFYGFQDICKHLKKYIRLTQPKFRLSLPDIGNWIFFQCIIFKFMLYIFLYRVLEISKICLKTGLECDSTKNPETFVAFIFFFLVRSQSYAKNLHRKTSEC